MPSYGSLVARSPLKHSSFGFRPCGMKRLADCRARLCSRQRCILSTISRSTLDRGKSFRLRKHQVRQCVWPHLFVSSHIDQSTSVRQEEEPELITNLIFLDDEVFSNFGEVIDTTDASCREFR
jgi:hypothetical protein